MRWEPRWSLFGWRLRIAAVDWVFVYNYDVGELIFELHPFVWLWRFERNPCGMVGWKWLCGPVHMDWVRLGRIP